MSKIKILKRLFKNYTSKFIDKILLAGFFSIIVAASTSATAWLLDPAIEKIFLNKDQTLIILIPIAIIIAFSAKGTSLYFAKLLMINVSEEVKKMMQTDMLRSFIKADTEIIENKHSGKYISNLNFDVNQITILLADALLSLFKDSLTLIGLLIVMFFQNWKLSLIAIFMIPLASITAKILAKRMGKVTTQAQEKSGDLNRYLIDLFKNHKIIKIFQRENFEEKRSEKFVNDLKEKSAKIHAVYIRSAPVMEILTGIMIAILIFYSGKLIINDELGINNFFSFLAAMMLAYQPVKTLTKVNVGIGQGLAAAERILPIIDNQNEISINEEGEKINITEGNIILDKINFAYKSNPENKVLQDMSLKFTGGKMTALVGHSGSGKSTLLNMIPRIYLPTSGNIYFDNQDISKVNLVSLRNQISIVDQNTTLFDDTVFNNIKYARPNADKEDIIAAAKLSMSDDFINNLENGYETMIGENGVKLSGGEKQRLSIARAFLKNSRIILLDEATSSLDSETEEKIQKALDKLTTNKTTIVIAHRLSTILNSDNIYVVDNGKIVDSGKHDDLLNNSKIYKNFYQRQLKQN
ncbi:lipid A export ATP-binding/permease protein MsbA [Candidatus Pelagibacter sp. HTCC7211]|jgi:subfamily B ATP-binding cassette protein MsbA|uniref:ABC transporter ATP-binding protein n=1 Tax=Pelagibacter sp. (strain HTCC7211) TaxID=439493 RepID=UPI000183B71D|nr:ABC transporter ATP-binding protein [Candidatus Pelagibacter sp. HTCC7211]EDZ60438.1 lipid A export ATP-binding/permease protein MsbA [Candidatus Pelagibacter sp. HTCC7211]